MRAILRRVIVAAAAVSALGTSPLLAQSRVNRDVLPSRTALGRLGLERQWFSVIPLAGVNERVLRIDYLYGLFFTQTNLGRLYVIDPESGRIFWRRQLSAENAALQTYVREAVAPAANSTCVFAATSNELYCFERATGNIIWTQVLEAGTKGGSSTPLEGLSTVSSPVAADEFLVVVGQASGRLVAYSLQDPKTGRLRKIPKYAWSWQTNKTLTSRPIMAQALTVFGSNDGKLYVATNEKPNILFRFRTGGPISADLGLMDTRTILVPSQDENVYSIDLFTGEKHWNFASSSPVDHQPIVAGDDVFVVNTAGLLSNLDGKTGIPRWTQRTQGGQVLSVGRTRIYLQSHDFDMFIIDRATGGVIADPRSTREQSGLMLRDFRIDLTNYVNDRIYLATPGGILMCLREIGETSPMLCRDPNQPPFGYLPPRTKTTKPIIPAASEGGDDSAPKAKPAAKAKKKADDEDSEEEPKDEKKDDAKKEEMEKDE